MSKRTNEDLNNNNAAAKKAKPAAAASEFPLPWPNPPTLQHGQFTRAELRALMDAHDFCVIENVLDPARTKHYLEQFFGAYASLHDALVGETPLGFDLTRPATLANGNTPPYKGSGMVAVDGTAGLKVLHEMRTDANIARAFVDYYGVASADELAKSNDRWGAMLPNAARTQLEPHLDANVRRAERTLAEDVIQGIVVLQQAPQPDQGFVIYPNHGKDLSKWRGEHARDEDYYRVPDDELPLLGRGRVINPKAGSLILWKSTAPHGNTSGGGKKTTVGRVVAYLTAYPWAKLSSSAIEKLQKAYVDNTTLGHNLLRPHAQKVGGTRWGPKLQWRYGAAHLNRFASVADLPPSLRPPPPTTN